jgi:hypothetical protein
MATLTQKLAAERKIRELIETEGLPEPSRIEYGHTCIRLFWEESKVVLVIDIDEPPPGFELVGEQLEDVAEIAELLGDDEPAAEEPLDEDEAA